jgi:hypothetical protein
MESYLKIARKRALALAVTLDTSLGMLETANLTGGSEWMDSQAVQ